MNDKDPKEQQVEININLDTTPVLYTDRVMMSANEDGLVLNFCQGLGSPNQIRVVSRIGMSRNHAKKFLKELGRLLERTEGSIETGKKPHIA